MPHDFSLVETAPDLADRYRVLGATTEESLSTIVSSVGTRAPWLPAVIEEDRTLNYGQVLDLVSRAAGWLRQQGVKPGDVVTWQTPNWTESYVLGLAIWYLGAVSNPVVTIYREHELRVIVDQCRPDVVIAPADYRGCRHVDMFESVFSELGWQPRVKIVLRGDAPGWSTFDQVTSGTVAAPTPLRADDPALILFTSGTTSAPKGAIHTSRTLVSPSVQINRHWGWTFDDVSYMPAPLPHVTGIMIGMVCPVLAGGPVVLADRWDPSIAASEILRHRVSMMSGATVFLQELTEELRAQGRLAEIKAFSCGGANISTDIISSAQEQGISAWRCYGLTEVPCATVMSSHQPLSARAETDGLPGPGVEVVPVRDDGSPCGFDEDGELLVRGPQRMLGYVRAEQNEGVIDAEGWVHTGDLGRVDALGRVTITGRTKDIINRAGEKISARDLEELIALHPAVREVAVVAAPHDRYGEVPVAFIRLRPGAEQPTVEELTNYLRDHQLPKMKLPAMWQFVDEIPATPTGKIKKFELVARLPS